MNDPTGKIAQDLVRRGLGVPAVFMLESMKPLSVLAQQTVLVTSPLAALCGYRGMFEQLAHIFEDRQHMEDLALEVERLMEEPGHE